LSLDALIERKEEVYPGRICEVTLAPLLLHLGDDLAAAPLDTASLKTENQQKAIKWRGKGQNYGFMEPAPPFLQEEGGTSPSPTSPSPAGIFIQI
jgi:hypothetical protein